MRKLFLLVVIVMAAITASAQEGIYLGGEYDSVLDVKINGGSDKAVNHAYSQLKKRIEEFKLS
jgi:hypothetical protein